MSMTVLLTLWNAYNIRIINKKRMLHKAERKERGIFINVRSRWEGGLRDKRICFNPYYNPLHMKQHLPRAYCVSDMVLNKFRYTYTFSNFIDELFHCNRKDPQCCQQSIFISLLRSLSLSWMTILYQFSEVKYLLPHIYFQLMAMLHISPRKIEEIRGN